MRSEKTTETMMYEAITTVIRRKGEKIQLVDYTCAESILLDFVPSGRAAVEETDAKNKVKRGIADGVKPFYLIFLELCGFRRDAGETETIAQEVRILSHFPIPRRGWLLVTRELLMMPCKHKA